MRKTLFALRYYIAELPITLAQAAGVAVAGTAIGASISPFSACDPGTCCLHGAVAGLITGFAGASWFTVARARDFDLS